MRDELGRFVKGNRASPETEFKKGTHWRVRKPYWDYQWLRHEYEDNRRSAAEIAAQFGVTENAIFYWIHKHGIKTRDTTTIRAEKYWGLSGERNGMYGCVGENNPNWKGGLTPARQALYVSGEWSRIVSAVWMRDGGICQRCGRAKRNGDEYHIHHIISFAEEKYRTDTDNLILVCAECHRWIHSKRNRNSEFIGKEVANGS